MSGRIRRTDLKEVVAELRRRPLRVMRIFAVWWRAFAEQRGRTHAAELPAIASTTELLAWRPAGSPDISIVVPVFNQIATAMDCLRSLVAATTEEAKVELVVVDDASTDPEAERLRALPGITYHRNRNNAGFVGACNTGAQLARGRLLVFLNSDTLVTPGWLERLVGMLKEPGVGLVGASLRYPDGRLQEAGGLVFADASGWNYGRNGHPADPRYCTRRDSHYCSGAALAVTRKRFTEMGGFDARFAPGYYEDTDLAMRVRASGARVVYEPEAVVVHLEGASAGTDTSQGMKAAQVVNRERFRELWRETLLQAHPAPGTDADLVVRTEGAAWAVACCGEEPEACFLEALETLVERGCVVDLFLGGFLSEERVRGLRSRGVYVWPREWHATGRWLLVRHGHAAQGLLVDGSPASLHWMKSVADDLGHGPRLWLGSGDLPKRAGLTPVSGPSGVVAALGL